MVFDGQGSRRATIGRRVLRQGMHGDDVKALQERLNELGFEAGDADGRFGILTKEAVREFQRAHRLRVDGIAGSEVFSALMSLSAHKRITHVVGERERLYDVARKYNVPVELLIRVNRLKEDTYLYKSQRLIIPIRTVKGYCRDDSDISDISGVSKGQGQGAFDSTQGRGSCTRGMHHESLTLLAHCWFLVDSEGRVRGDIRPELLALASRDAGNAREMGSARKEGNPRKAGKAELSIAVRFGQEGLPAAEVAHTVLATRKARSAAIRGLLDEASRSGAREIEIWLDDLDIEDRYYFYSFIRDLSKSLRANNRQVSVAIPAAGDAQRYGEAGAGTMGPAGKEGGGEALSPVFDYEEIARHADYVTLLALDEHRKESIPGPIASVEWVKGAIRYALSYIPCWKMILAVPTYGYDWPEAGRNQSQSHTLSYDESQIISSTFKSTIEWDSRAMAPYFRYRSFRVNHHVWFESAQSMLAKVDLVEKYNLAGIALWWLGPEDPAIWSGINARFKVRR